MAYPTHLPVIGGLLILCPLLSSPTQAASEPLGKTLLARGSVTAVRGSGSEAIRRLSPVFRQDTLKAGNNARAQFRMIDDAYINLQENSELRLHDYTLKGKDEGNVVMELISGGLRTITGAVGKKDKSDYQLRTPSATIGIRGTLYEAEIVPEGMYVGAWNGSISIRSHSGACDLQLGQGQRYSYAFVDKQGKCQPLRGIPQVFRDGHSADNMVGVSPDVVEFGPLLDNPQPELPYRAVVIGSGNTLLSTGQAGNTDRPTPLISTNGGVLSAGDAAVRDYGQNIGGYAVSWGRWAEYNSSPGLNAAPAPVADADGVIWASYQATDPGIVANRVGEVRYDTMVGSLVQSSLGAVSNVAVQMDVNFGSGAVSNGSISANVPGHTWAGVFDGQVQNGDLSLNYNGGNLVDSATGAFTAANGFIDGDFVGNNAQAVAGGFGMQDTANPAHQIGGAFLVGQ